jgi:ADP-ribosylglycohydrolase
MDATAMSLHCIWTTESAEEAIIKAMNLCGDSDSIGSVVGQLCRCSIWSICIPKRMDWSYSTVEW